jgi:ABC-type multidrug transport system ATPase subunit
LIDDSFCKYKGKDVKRLFYSFIKLGLRNKTIIYASSKRRFIEHCDEFRILDSGQILAQGKKENLGEIFEGLLASKKIDTGSSLLDVNVKESVSSFFKRVDELSAGEQARLQCEL